MPKTRSTLEFSPLDPQPTHSLRRWIYEEVRRAILDGRLPPGTRLPSSRSLAEQFGVARGTVVEAFEQLITEGYVRSTVGAGTFVNADLQEYLLQPEVSKPSAAARPMPSDKSLSKRGAHLAQQTLFARGIHDKPLFNPFMPALDEFPVDLWAKLVSRSARQCTWAMLADSDPLGYAPLRTNIAHYLGVSRGLSASPEQILIVGSVQQGLDLAGRLLLEPGDRVWMEDPGYPGARAVLEAHGARMVPVPVDSQGMQVAVGRKAGKGARMAYVTPSRQAPLGVAMSLARRIELLEWANRHGAWVFEDDYDAEFRYQGKPIAALKSIDEKQRVIYAGSFSKTMFPALRVSYLVLPPGLVDAFVAARSLTSRFSPVLEQAALATFIEEGHYARHLRRMNLLYAERRKVLVDEVEHAAQIFECVTGDAAGLSLVARLSPHVSEAQAVRAARARQLYIQPLGAYALKHPSPPGLILGFASAPPRLIRSAMKLLQDSLR